MRVRHDDNTIVFCVCSNIWYIASIDMSPLSGVDVLVDERV